MLIQLSIQNYTLIEQCQINFQPGFNALTGETGAGKSMILGALGVALGNRFENSSIRDESKPCVIQASYILENPHPEFKGLLNDYLEDGDDCLIIRREISATGKPRNYLNGHVVNVSHLRKLGDFLIDIHGQHDSQRIFAPSLHLLYIHQLALRSPKNELYRENLEKYQEFYREYQQVQKKLSEILSLQDGKERELDLLSFQIDEIESVSPEENEKEALEEEKIRLQHSEKLFEVTGRILRVLDDQDGSASSLLSTVFRDWSELQRIDESVAEMSEKMGEAQSQLEEVIQNLRGYQESLSFDDTRLDEIHDRLEQMDTILRKYGPTVEDVRKFLEESKIKHEKLANYEVHYGELEKERVTIEKEMLKCTTILSKYRTKVGASLSKHVQQELLDLGIKKSNFQCQHEDVDFNFMGKDGIEFQMSLNAGESLQPLSKIASGGEASRIMLAIKHALAEAEEIPTLIFDEIDANIGGRLGSQVGEKIRDICGNHQVILITHLPQIASYAKAHFKVVKEFREDETFIRCELLDPERRVQELSEMMSGDKKTAISKTHAEELLRQTQKP